jgi:predicted alpha/beta superfamily hydrolase
MRKRGFFVLAIAAVLIASGAFLFIWRETPAPSLFEGGTTSILTPPPSPNGTRYRIYAHVPSACRRRACRALYILDGDLWIAEFTRAANELAARDAMDPVVLIGIGYVDIINSATRRKYDFSPSFGRTPGHTGGADAYLQFFQRTIIPFAEAHLPIAPGERALAGHSYGGLFAAYALCREPDLFRAYLIMSPALWFDGGKIYTERCRDPLHATQVFLAANAMGDLASDAMVHDVHRLEMLLSGRRQILVRSDTFAGRDHNGVVAPAVRMSLPRLFPAQR